MAVWPSPVLAETTSVNEIVVRALAYLEQSYARAPALVVGLAALLVLPPLAISGALLRWLTSSRPVYARLPAGLEETAAAGPAYIDIIGSSGEVGRRAIDRQLLQIGRQDDNDIRLDESTVHRYHAIIERSVDLGLTIVDVSGPEGNGVRLNGQQVARAGLVDGDLIELGAAQLRVIFAETSVAEASSPQG